ncbi:MAG TPA: acyl-ACP--UDP-N-acetylglucosamine O-acyltransferase [Vicinamibacterales bacterium]|nr:acyl-ACP--UDP-N-acetylglucosamine O-acyltransferase [Vicinamibacterales bacterium]
MTQDATPAPDLTALQARHFYRYPSRLVDSIVDYDRGRRLVAIKQVTVNEEFFQGHFPGLPLMPAVLQIESLTQAAAALVLETIGQPTARVALRGINGGKFRRGVVPGDQLRLELTLLRARTRLAVVQASAFVAGDVVAEATLLLAIEPGLASIHPTAIVHAGARIGRGSVIGPYCVIGPHVSIGERCRLGASAVIDGQTTIGDETEIFPMASIGLAPQDLKYHGEPTRLTIGRRNIFREFVQINRGTEGGGGETRIGDGNLFMAYVHVAHDCHVGSNTIFGAHATLGGHVTVEDFANISAGSAVHQFCRVGPYAFIGGYSVVTKDAAPYARTIGARPARVFGVNSIGLTRRGFTPDSISQLKRAYRYLLQSKLNTSRALAAIERDASLTAPEVAALVDFIRTSKRGVILRRPTRRTEELVAED